MKVDLNLPDFTKSRWFSPAEILLVYKVKKAASANTKRFIYESSSHKNDFPKAAVNFTTRPVKIVGDFLVVVNPSGFQKPINMASSGFWKPFCDSTSGFRYKWQNFAWKQ